MHFEDTVDITAAPVRVWDIATDVGRLAEWVPNFTASEAVGPQPLAVGSGATIRQRGLPPTRWTVTVLEPGRSFTWTARTGLLRMEATHEVESIDGGARSRLTLDVGGLGPLGVLLRRALRAQIRAENRALKERAEG